MVAPFTIEKPADLSEALDILAQGDEMVRPVGGGTGLTLLMKYGFFEPTTLVSLQRLAPAHRSITLTADGALSLGATATLRDIEDAPLVTEHTPLLRAALDRLATVRLRNVAHLGGAVAHGHPQMDLPPVLVALGARVRVARAGGAQRWIDAEELFQGYYETAVGDDELITEVVLPTHGADRATYRKVTARTVDDWPVLGVAARGRCEDGAVVELGVALGAIGDRPVRLHAVESALRGHRVTPALVAEAAEGAAEELDVHDGPDGTARFQRRIVAVHVRRALSEVLETGSES